MIFIGPVLPPNAPKFLLSRLLDMNPLKSLAFRGTCTDQPFQISHHYSLLSMANRHANLGADNVGDQSLIPTRKNVLMDIVSRIAHAEYYD